MITMSFSSVCTVNFRFTSKNILHTVGHNLLLLYAAVILN